MQMQQCLDKQRPAHVSGCNERACIQCVYVARMGESDRTSQTRDCHSPIMANGVPQTMTHNGLGMGLHIVPLLPLRIFASLTPMYASLRAGLPTVTDQVFSP
jgi:hypothetical protein